MEEKRKGRIGWNRNFCAWRKFRQMFTKYSLQVFLKVVILWISTRKPSSKESMGNGYGEHRTLMLSPMQKSTGELSLILGPSKQGTHLESPFT